MKKLLALMIVMIVTGCNTDSKIASRNLSKAAEMFEINRRIVFYNGITNDYILSVEGLCSVDLAHNYNQVQLTCKTGPQTYKKHFLGLSDNVTYFAEQLEPVKVSTYHYKVIFKPQSIISDVDLKVR